MLPLRADCYRPSVVGPCIEIDGLLHYGELLPDGNSIERLIIPYQCCNLQTVIATGTHRDCGHLNATMTHGCLQFHLDCGPRRCHDMVSRCFICFRRNANLNLRWRNPFSIEIPRSIWQHPFTTLTMDHLSLGEKQTCLTMLCMNTGYVQLQLVESQTTAEACAALTTLTIRFCARIETLYCDRLAAYGSIDRKLGCKLIQTPPYAHWETGTIERMNKHVLDRLRSILKSTPIISQSDLDLVSFWLNNHPLVLHTTSFSSSDNGSSGIVSRIPLTPSVLAFGHCQSWSLKSPSSLLTVRDWNFKYCWEHPD